MEKTTAKNKRFLIIGLIALAVLIVAFALIYVLNIANPAAGLKHIEVEIVHEEGAGKAVDIETQAAYLRQALEEKGLIEGKETANGLYVLTVDGKTADEAKQEWWCFTKNGEMLMTGVDATPVADGDRFEITFTIGW